MSLFEQIANASRPQIEPLKMYSFKPSPGAPKEEEIETVIAESLSRAVEKNPKMITYYLHTITK